MQIKNPSLFSISTHTHTPGWRQGSRGRTPCHIRSCEKVQARRTAAWSMASAKERCPLETSAQTQNQSLSATSPQPHRQKGHSEKGTEKESQQEERRRENNIFSIIEHNSHWNQFFFFPFFLVRSAQVWTKEENKNKNKLACLEYKRKCDIHQLIMHLLSDV